MASLLRAIHALLYETPGGLSGWLSRYAYWRDQGPRA